MRVWFTFDLGDDVFQPGPRSTEPLAQGRVRDAEDRGSLLGLHAFDANQEQHLTVRCAEHGEPPFEMREPDGLVRFGLRLTGSIVSFDAEQKEPAHVDELPSPVSYETRCARS